MDWFGLILVTAAACFLLARPQKALRVGSFRGSTLAGFFLLTCGMTFPLILHLDRLMLAAGAGPDAYIGLWNLWWTKTALLHGADPLRTDWIFHPNGTSLALHTFALTYGVASLPLQLLAGLFIRGPIDLLAVAGNLLLLASFTLSGYLLYRLALGETGSRRASILAGVVFAYTNYRFSNTVRLHVICTELIVLSAWAWVAWLRTPSRRGFARLCGSLVLLVYASLEYAAFSTILLLILALPSVRGRLRRSRPAGRTTAGSAGRIPVPFTVGTFIVFLLLLLPLLLELGRRWGEGGTAFDPRLAVFFSADLADFILPNPRHPFWGRAVSAVTAGFHRGDGGFGLSLGGTALACFVLASIRCFRERKGRTWFWGFLVFWALSLGPRLHVGGSVLEGFPLPQAWLTTMVPFLAGSRTPIRFLAPAWICFSMTIAWGWATLALSKDGASSGRPAEAERGPMLLDRIWIPLIVLILFESLSAPFPLVRVPVPEVYRAVKGAPGTAALVHVPGIPAREDLLYQTVHGQRLVQNLESAIPLRSHRGIDPFAQPHWQALTQNLSRPGWIESLPQAQRDTLIAALRGFLREYGIRFVVLSRTLPALAPDARSFVSRPLLDDESFRACRDHLRLLSPVKETPVEDAVLFEFEAPAIADASRRLPGE